MVVNQTEVTLSVEVTGASFVDGGVASLLVAPGTTLHLVNDVHFGGIARPPTSWLTHVRVFDGEDAYYSGAVAEPAFVVERSGDPDESCSFASYTFTATRSRE